MPGAPTPTYALEALRRERRERAIEDLLFSYPSLIDPILRRPTRQVVLSKDSRADLLFETGRTVVLVEIKRDTIRPGTVTQLERYATRLNLPAKRIRGILIAPAITPRAESRLATSPFQFAFRQLGRDIPTSVKICLHCREPYDARLAKCPQDGSPRTL